MLKALSKQFLTNMVFGEVRLTEASLARKFSIMRFPTIMVLTEGDKYLGVSYQGALQID